jgi:hypothetical protein
MRVQMKVHMSGLRNGVEWPAVGDVVDLPDEEATVLVGQGSAELAEKSAKKSAVEAATAPPADETATVSSKPGPKPGPRTGK